MREIEVFGLEVQFDSIIKSTNAETRMRLINACNLFKLLKCKAAEIQPTCPCPGCKLQPLPNRRSQTLTFSLLICQSRRHISSRTYSRRRELPRQLAEVWADAILDEIWPDTDSKAVGLEGRKILLDEREHTRWNRQFVKGTGSTGCACRGCGHSRCCDFCG